MSYEPQPESPFRSSTRRKRWFVVPLVLLVLAAVMLWLNRDRFGRDTGAWKPSNPAAAEQEPPLLPPRAVERGPRPAES
jgi:hypothetical protein